MAAGSYDHTCKLWDTRTGKVRLTPQLSGVPDPIHCPEALQMFRFLHVITLVL